MVVSLLRRLVAEESGATAVEYALMLAAVILIGISGIGALGGANQAYWQSSVESLAAILSF